MWSIVRRRVGMAAVALTGAAFGMGAHVLSAQAVPLVVRGLSFQGNNSIDGAILASAISTTNSNFFVRSPLFHWIGIGETRIFNQRVFNRDAYNLELFYRRSGFPDVKVDTTTRRDTKNIWITFHIKEGKPTIVKAITIDGADSVADRFRVVRELPILPGDVLNRYQVIAAQDTMTARLRERGFASARVEFTLTVDSSAKLATLAFKLVTGKPATFGPVAVSGFDQVDSAFIASLLTAREGRIFRAEELYRSQRALNASQLFSYANVQIDSAAFGKSDSTVAPLRVSVVEGKMHSAQASTGYATTDCVRTSLGWASRNFLGRGRLLSLNTDLWKIGVGAPFDFGICSGLRNDSVGSKRANYSLEGSLRQNGFLSPDNSLTFSLFAQRRSEYKVYLREEIGTTVAITRETTSHIPVTLAYRLSYGSTTANPATFCGYFNSCTAIDIKRLGERRLLGVASLRANRLRVNSLLDPTRGTSYSGEMSVASRFIGSSRSQEFVRLVADAAGYLPISRRSVLAAHARAGIIFTPKIGLPGGVENFVPPEQRLYLGGANDVRGYDQNEMGPVVYVVPRDSVNFDNVPPTFSASATRVSPVGGDHVLTGNLELRVPSPIFRDWLRLAAFVDGGALWGRGTSAEFRVTPGIGIRIVSPKFPPVRIDFAYNRYAMQSGPVYTTSAIPGGDLVLLRDGFIKPRPSTLTLHFSFGEPY